MPEFSIFVSHTREQSAAVRRLLTELTSRGFSLATNRHTVPPGKRVQAAVERSMTEATGCLVCFSTRSDGNIDYDADDVALANLHPTADGDAASWLIPVKLTRCELPDISFGGSPAKQLAAIELHADWDAELARLLAALPVPTTSPRTDALAAPPMPGGHSTMSVKVGTVMGPTTRITNVSGGVGADASSNYEIDKIVSDFATEFTNVKR